MEVACMKTILVGSVDSSWIVLEEMIAQKSPPEMVFSLDERYSENVSGYTPIHELAEKHNIPFKKFKKINDPENIAMIKAIQPDYLFVVGLSQLVGKELIESAKQGVIGLHPAPLPKFRGRAAVVWQILLGVRESKISMFMIDEGMDSGDILGQEPFTIGEGDYAADVTEKINAALHRLLKRVLPQVKEGTLQPVKQNDAEATYLLKRIPEDGLIDWREPGQKIHTLIRAVSHPYPGAFANYDGQHRVIFWHADLLENKQYFGIPGQIARKEGDVLEIVCTDGLLRVNDYDNIDNVSLIVGHKFK
jgi:methionyl-tRNA formyltransferase